MDPEDAKLTDEAKLVAIKPNKAGDLADFIHRLDMLLERMIEKKDGKHLFRLLMLKVEELLTTHPFMGFPYQSWKQGFNLYLRSNLTRTCRS